jgi:hypothetical protein
MNHSERTETASIPRVPKAVPFREFIKGIGLLVLHNFRLYRSSSAQNHEQTV